VAFTHYNIAGDAIGLALRLRMSYLPDALILDSTVKSNFDKLCGDPPPKDGCFNDPRLAKRITGTVTFPEIGLGPLVRAQIDGVYVHDLEHDFVLDKQAAVPTVYYRPIRQLTFALSQSVEFNKANVFGFTSVSSYLSAQNQSNPDLQTLLRFPDVPSHALAQRLVITWDRRDDPFNPHRGTLFTSALEHTDWFADQALCSDSSQQKCIADPGGHTLRFSETIAGYIPVTKKITLAAELRTGVNVQLADDSSSYPDRLFFLGGVLSMRGFYQDSMVTQEDADHIIHDLSHPPATGNPFTIGDVALRGGNLMINPKVELRIPVVSPLETVVFVDAGNIWYDPMYIFRNGLTLRTTVGSGIRVVTPVGPLAFDVGLNPSRAFGWPNRQRPWEDYAAFHFSIGLF
jgi:outer membrane protein assembly factor BamA